jgi:hypothetical protein
MGTRSAVFDEVRVDEALGTPRDARGLCERRTSH